MIAIGTLGLNIYLSYIVIPKGFFPQQDTGRLIGKHHRRPGSSPSSRCPQKIRQLSGIVQSDPGVDTVLAFTGGGGGTTTNTGRVFISLKPLAQRKCAPPTRSSTGCGRSSPSCRAPRCSCRRCRT